MINGYYGLFPCAVSVNYPYNFLVNYASISVYLNLLYVLLHNCYLYYCITVVSDIVMNSNTAIYIFIHSQVEYS